VAWSIEGARGARWTAAEWVGRNAAGFLVPALDRAGAGTLARAFATALEMGTGELSLREWLDDDATSVRFAHAVEAALLEIRREGPRAWREPERYASFARAVGDLTRLCRRDGNEELQKIFRDPPLLWDRNP
jgi:hypothetical protein